MGRRIFEAGHLFQIFTIFSNTFPGFFSINKAKEKKHCLFRINAVKVSNKIIEYHFTYNMAKGKRSFIGKRVTFGARSYGSWNPQRSVPDFKQFKIFVDFLLFRGWNFDLSDP